MTAWVRAAWLLTVSIVAVEILRLLTHAPVCCSTPSSTPSPESLAFSTQSGSGQRVTAASCNMWDIQAAIKAVHDGGTVLVPNTSGGNPCNWNGADTSHAATFVPPITISGKAITVAPQSAGNVQITDATPFGGPNQDCVNPANGQSNDSFYLIQIKEAKTGSVEWKNFTFTGGWGHGPNNNCDHSTIVLYPPGGFGPETNGQPALIHANTWISNGPGIADAMDVYTHRGVIYNNVMDARPNTNPLCSPNGGCDTDFVRQQMENLGARDWDTASTYGTLDTGGAHNLYIEDNQLYNITNRALDNSANARTVIRHNLFQDSSFSSHGEDTGPIGVRHVEVYNNTFSWTDRTSIAMDYWIFIRGGLWLIHDNTMDDINASGNHAAIKVTVMNLRRNGGPLACYGPSDNPRQGYPAPHQFGQGFNGTREFTEVSYVWNNGSSNGDCGGGSGDLCLSDYDCGASDSCNNCTSQGSTAQYVVQGRDWNSTARSGYSTYPYPHPLRR